MRSPPSISRSSQPVTVSGIGMRPRSQSRRTSSATYVTKCGASMLNARLAKFSGRCLAISASARVM